jgi:hypothetical protein
MPSRYLEASWMPHVVLDGSIDLNLLSRNFEPTFVREPYIIKLQDIFVNKSGRSALVPAVVVDQKNQNFLIEIFAKEGSTTIRLFPETDPEKTDGVRMALAQLSAIIQKQFGTLRVAKTNISEFLPVEYSG